VGDGRQRIDGLRGADGWCGALTAGAAVGVLDVPCKRPGRVGRGLERLAEQGWVTRFEDWRRISRLTRPPGSFDEAGRCARWIVERWFA